jgi:hypothetical protein
MTTDPAASSVSAGAERTWQATVRLPYAEYAELKRWVIDHGGEVRSSVHLSAGAGQVPADTIKKARALAGEYDRGWRHDTPIPHQWAARAYAVLAALVAVDAQEPKT